MTALGIKGTDITRKIGASSGAISQWRKGVSAPSGKYLVGLAKMFKCDPEWLLSDDDESAMVSTDSKTTGSQGIGESNGDYLVELASASAVTKDILDIAKNLTKERQDLLLAMAKTMLEDGKK